MRGSLKVLLVPILKTLLLLLIFEVLATAILPIFGLVKYRIPFNILIVLFIGFKLETPYIAFLVLIFQYFHSFFSIEGWEMGTISGVLVCIIISYLKDLLHFSSAGITILVTQLFQVIWFLITSLLLYMKTQSFSYIVEKFWRFLPESIVISLLAPIFFIILDQIWQVDEQGMLGDNA